MPDNTDYWPPLSWDAVVHALDADGPLSPAVIDRLRGEITPWDCEEWPAEVGHALLRRLVRREGE